jgi:hypothetical protein
MRRHPHIGHGLVTGATVLCLLLGAGPAVGAAPSSASPTNRAAAALTPPPPDRCWANGTRIKSPSSPTVYLIGPEGIWYPIANETTYFNLFNSWAGLTVSSDFSCKDPAGGSLDGAYLVKKNTDPKVYIWNNVIRLFQPIPDETTFNYYHFAWSKIRVRSTDIGPIGPEWGTT